jgi:hypothetical protein
MDGWMRDVNELIVFALLFALMLAASEIGFTLARRFHAAGGAPSSEVSAIQGAVLGLLALLLGFSFSVAMSRFEARKELIRDEANVIGTAYLRTELLPEPHRTNVARAMRQYLDTRFELQKLGFAPDALRATHRRSGELQARMWADITTVARAHPESETMALVVSSMNELIDAHGMQMAAVRNRVPSSIFALLFCVAIASLGLTGYASGPFHRQNAALTFVVALLVTAVILLIFDLHRPARGVITVDLSAYEDLRAALTTVTAGAQPP